MSDWTTEGMAKARDLLTALELLRAIVELPPMCLDRTETEGLDGYITTPPLERASKAAHALVFERACELAELYEDHRENMEKRYVHLERERARAAKR